MVSMLSLTLAFEVCKTNIFLQTSAMLTYLKEK